MATRAQQARRFTAHRAADLTLKPMIWYHRDDLENLRRQGLKKLAKVADKIELDRKGVLFYANYFAREHELVLRIGSR